MTLGFSEEFAETILADTASNTSDEDLNMYVSLVQPWRTPMAEDLKKANLPQRIVALVQDTNVDIQCSADLKRVASACAKAYKMALANTK